MALAFPPSSGQDRCVVRLYALADNELGDALGEVMTARVTQLLWAGLRYLVMCGPAGCTIYFCESGKLKFFVSDPATIALFQGNRLGLLHEPTQTVQYWNLDKNRMVDSVNLSLQDRRLITVVGVGYFAFALYNDGSVQAFYVTKSNIKKIGQFDQLFPITRAGVEKGGASSLLLACSLSSRKVLVGLRGGDTIHKLEYKNEKVLVDSVQEKLASPHVLVAISLNGRRCLALNKETNKCNALVMNFSASKLPAAEENVEIKSSVNCEKGGKRANPRVEPVDKRPVAVSAVEISSAPPEKPSGAGSKRLTPNHGIKGGGTPQWGITHGATLAIVGVSLAALFVLARRIISF
ncbi:hypothetical protein MOQ_004251 [Trypanosoma cruzi marinkellei]|uniref:Trans-sialidase n=1 Tax=Trypanosoma cruzi marinkellei TaxID=85056 RepID=K2MA02_TRYCR|nr:hypothetical protein MOQ_004251 [Trypanosoma cruzi marinkellei]